MSGRCPHRCLPEAARTRDASELPFAVLVFKTCKFRAGPSTYDLDLEVVTGSRAACKSLVVGHTCLINTVPARANLTLGQQDAGGCRSAGAVAGLFPDRPRPQRREFSDGQGGQPSCRHVPWVCPTRLCPYRCRNRHHLHGHRLQGGRRHRVQPRRHRSLLQHLRGLPLLPDRQRRRQRHGACTPADGRQRRQFSDLS